LFGARNYATGVDVWATGCVFAELLLRVGSTDFFHSFMQSHMWLYPAVLVLVSFSKFINYQCRQTDRKQTVYFNAFLMSMLTVFQWLVVLVLSIPYVSAVQENYDCLKQLLRM